jgi:hypothetical protein
VRSPDLNVAGTEIVIKRRPINLVEILLRLSFLPPGSRFWDFSRCSVPDVVCPLANGVAYPAVSVPDASQLPLTNPDSTASAGRNLEVLRGLSELDLLKLLGQLQEQDSAPVLSSTSGASEEVGRSTSSVPVTGNTIRLDTTPPPGF